MILVLFPLQRIFFFEQKGQIFLFVISTLEDALFENIPCCYGNNEFKLVQSDFF